MSIVKNIIDVITGKDWIYRLLGIPFIAAIMPILFFNVDPFKDPKFYFVFCIPMGIVYTSIYWHADILIMKYYQGRFPALYQNKKRILYQSVVIVLMTIFIKLVFNWILPAPSGEVNESVSCIDDLFKGTFSALFVTLTIASIYEANYSIQMWKQSRLETEQLKKASLKAQLETLKNQVNPHFLFNSLNTLAYIIPDNPDMAVQYVSELSKVYRYILDMKGKELISLEEEMNCIQSYQFLLNIRFRENLKFDIQIDPNKLNYYIVPLSLQMLIENAMKHNIVSSSKPLLVTIKTDGEYVNVSNNLQEKREKEPSTKTGLANIKNRYRLIANEEVVIEKNEATFVVRIPLIKMLF